MSAGTRWGSAAARSGGRCGESGGVCTSECQSGGMFYIVRFEVQRERERERERGEGWRDRESEEGGSHYRLLRSNFSVNVVAG